MERQKETVPFLRRGSLEQWSPLQTGEALRQLQEMIGAGATSSFDLAPVIDLAGSGA